MTFNKNIWIKSLLTLVVTLLFATNSQAQDASGTFMGEDYFTVAVFSLMVIILLMVLVVAIVLLQILKVMVTQDAMKKAEAAGVTYVPAPSAWSQWMGSLTNAVPLDKEDTIELDHDYDGIKELDNHLPPWWTALFYITIAFGVVYMLNYHVFKTAPLSAEEYEIAMAMAESAKSNTTTEEATIDESNITFSDDPTILASGKTTYDRNCVACHKAAGEGGIGPNLTDEYWLHGGTALETYNTIKNGVPEKGMIAWKDVLSPAKIYEVNSYIATLRGTNPPNAKGPQGDKMIEAADSTSVSQ